MEANQWPQLLNVNTEEKIEINTSPFSIGRGLNCNTVIASKLVSRIHCIFTNTKDGWILTDKSTNGTILNGKVMKGASSNVLKERDMIILMEEPHVYTFLPPPQPPPPVAEEIVINSHLVSNLGDKVKSEQESATEKKLESYDSLQHNNVETTAKLNAAASTQNYMDIVEDEFTCSICSELFIKAVTLNCSHTFCKYCIEVWEKNKSICPICRTKITQINPSLVLDNYISKVLEKTPDEVKERRKKVICARAEEEEKHVPCRSVRQRQIYNNRRNVRITDSAATIVHHNESVIIELSDSETDGDDPDEDDDSSYFDDDSEFQIQMHDWEDELINANWFNIPTSGYATRSGAIYRGSGACYTCGQHGHWANGCPNRGSRRN